MVLLVELVVTVEGGEFLIGVFVVDMDVVGLVSACMSLLMFLLESLCLSALDLSV